nr:hypothetical protein [Tanacetum cinerariifolium]
MEMDEALVPHARRLRIGRSNFRLLSDISSKESTLQLVYDVLRLTPFFKAFLVTADVSKNYMQEFWATTTVHHHFIRFTMDNNKHIVNLESFREMLHICPRLPDQSFFEPPFEEEILAFLRFLGHSGAIKRLTDVEHKDTKKINEMYYPRFTKKTRSSSNTTFTPLTAVTGPRLSTSAKGKQPATTFKAKSLSALLEVAMTEAQQLKLATKRSLQETHISQASGSGVDERIGSIPGVLDVPTGESEEEISCNSTNEEGDDDNDDEGDDGDEGEEGNDDDDQDNDDPKDEGNDEDDQEEGSNDEQASDEEEFIHLSLSTHAEEEIKDEESFDPIPKKPENTNDERNGIEFIFKITSQMDVQTSTLVAPLPMSAPTLTPSSIATITTTQQAPTPLTTTPSTLLQDLPNFGSLFGFVHRLKTLEANFSEFTQTNQFVGAVSSIPGIVHRYMDQRMNEAVKEAIQLQSDRLHGEAQKENEEFLQTINENMQKIIKEQVKEQGKVQVSKILPKIEQTVNEQLEAEVLTRSSNSSKTSYTVAADLSEMELKKILIEKIENTYGDTITLKRRRDDDADKDEEPSVGSDRGSKRSREGKEPESASAPKEKATKSTFKSTQGSKSRQTSVSESATADEPMQTTFEMEEPSHPEFETGDDDQPIVEPSQHPESIQPRISDLAKQTDSRSSFNELMDTPVEFFAFLMNRLKVDTLTLELLAGPTYELMKGSCKSLVELKFFLEEVYKATIDQLDWVNPEGQQYPYNLLKPLPLIPNSQGHRVIPFNHFINNDLENLCGGASSRKYTTSVTKTKAGDYGHIKWIEDLVPRTMWIQEPESAHDVYSKRRFIAVTKLKIVEWHNYKPLDWITVRQDDDNLYKFKEGDFKRLRIQGIEDMLLLLVQGKLTNLKVEEGFGFNKKLNLTKPDTYRSDLKRKEDCIAYSNPRGFLYQNKDKQNMFMRIDELHKFSDGTLTDVRTALDDCLKGIRMKYLPQSIWRESDKDRAATMIQDIDKMLKTRRIMRSLERFVGGRLYEGDFRMLQRTI